MSERHRSEERALGAWSPAGEMGRFFEGDDPFDRFFRLGALLDAAATQRRSTRAMLSPQMDVEEDDDAYEVSVELPGMKREDIRIDLQQNVLTLQGEKRERRSSEDESEQDERGKQAKEGNGNGARRRRKTRRSRWSERSYGRFTRSFTLPPDADGEGLKAVFADGVLTITIPKSEQSRPRTIEIESNERD